MYANSVCTRLDPMYSGSYTHFTRCYRIFEFAYTSRGDCMASYVRIMYRTVQGGVYKNSVYTILDPMVCWTGMRIVRFILLAYQVLSYLPVCVYRLWHLYCVVCQCAV